MNLIRGDVMPTAKTTSSRSVLKANRRASIAKCHSHELVLLREHEERRRKEQH